MSFEIDRDSAAAQADNVHTLTDDQSGRDTEQAAVAMLRTLFPDIATGIQQGKRPGTLELVSDARAITEMVKIASLGHAQEDIDQEAVYDACYLVTRMLDALALIEGGDFDPKGASHE